MFPHLSLQELKEVWTFISLFSDEATEVQREKCLQICLEVVIICRFKLEKGKCL